MEVISVMLTVIATLFLGILVFALASVYFANTTSQSTISQYAQQVSQGLYIQKTSVQSYGNYYQTVVTIKDFNYKGPLYIVAFSTNPTLYGNSFVTPSMATNWAVQINGTMGTYKNIVIYDINLKEQYQGYVYLWQTTADATQQLVTFSQSPVFMEFLIYEPQLNGYVEVGYVWL